ncbi:MAG: DUF424 domain-containing protein [Candidatus Wukongarchaeota archaeon]|nr:DUF424 family protein [Candidatus Wukongarchaeota archaeon]
MFWCKTFSVKGQFVVAICDKNLLGKKIGNELKITVKESFYRGELVDEKKVLELMKKSNICNLMGKNIIDLALKNKFITKENIIFIGDVPHAQFIR